MSFGRLTLPPGAPLEFVTDVEGNWDYFQTLVARSAVLQWREKGDSELLSIVDGAFLVFGGDAPDKGPGDIRVTRALVTLHRDHPDRVFLLVGNRDCNKLRLFSELADGELPISDPVKYLDAHGWEGPKQQYEPFLAERGLERGRVSAFLWIAEKTMGGANFMQNRRTELELLGWPSSDLDVIDSFVASVDPKGAEAWTLEYLRVARVMLVIGDCLFIHGAVRSRGLLLVPAEEASRDGSLERQAPPLRLPSCTTLDDWAAELNAWKARQLRLFEAFPKFQQAKPAVDGDHGSIAVCLLSERWRGGQPLMMPSLVGCFVVTDSFLENGNGAPLDEDVAEFLTKNGVRRVFAGHQPQGQSPGVTRHLRTGITVLVADTSFSDLGADKSKNPANCRGAAVSSVMIFADRTEVSGLLADCSPHGYTLHVASGCDDEASAMIGRQFDDFSWGKTVVYGQLQTCFAEGYKLTYGLRAPEEVSAHLLVPKGNS